MITKKLWNSLDQSTRNAVGATLNKRQESYLQPYFHDFEFDNTGKILKEILECCNLQKDGTIKVTRTITPVYSNTPCRKSASEKKPVAKQVTDSFMLKYIKEQIKENPNDGAILIDTQINGMADKEEDIIRWLDHNKDQILKIREVDDFVRVPGQFNGDSYFIYKKPCKEFLTLQKYFNKLDTNFMLKKDSVHCDWVEGKRDDVTVGYRTLLCHKPYYCNQLLDWLRKNKATSSRVIARKDFDEQSPERYDGDGEDRESEWAGYYQYGLHIKILTPSGKIRKEDWMYVYNN